MAEVQPKEMNPFLLIEEGPYDRTIIEAHVKLAIGILKPEGGNSSNVKVDHIKRMTERIRLLALLTDVNSKEKDQTLISQYDSFYEVSTALITSVNSLKDRAISIRRDFNHENAKESSIELQDLREAYVLLTPRIETMKSESENLLKSIKARILKDKGLNLPSPILEQLSRVLDVATIIAPNILQYHATTDSLKKAHREIIQILIQYKQIRDRLAFHYDWAMASIHHYGHVPAAWRIISRRALGYFHYFAGISQPGEVKVLVPPATDAPEPKLPPYDNHLSSSTPVTIAGDFSNAYSPFGENWNSISTPPDVDDLNDIEYFTGDLEDPEVQRQLKDRERKRELKTSYQSSTPPLYTTDGRPIYIPTSYLDQLTDE